MTFGRLQVRPGMVVVDTAGSRLGRVTSVDLEHFEVDGPVGLTSVGYTSIRSIIDEEIVLDTTVQE